MAPIPIVSFYLILATVIDMNILLQTKMVLEMQHIEKKHC